jgi:hypothetical protein
MKMSSNLSSEFSKGYGVINKLSEDVDFSIISKPVPISGTDPIFIFWLNLTHICHSRIVDY